MYHGSWKNRTNLIPFAGMCVTDSPRVANRYAGSGTIWALDVDWTGLVEAEVDGYDRDANVAVGDDGAAPDGVDVITFLDEDPSGNQHQTWRLMSARAVAACRVVGACDDDGEIIEEETD